MRAQCCPFTTPVVFACAGCQGRPDGRQHCRAGHCHRPACAPTRAARGAGWRPGARALVHSAGAWRCTHEGGRCGGQRIHTASSWARCTHGSSRGHQAAGLAAQAFAVPSAGPGPRAGRRPAKDHTAVTHTSLQESREAPRVRVPSMTPDERSFQAAARALQARLTRGVVAELEADQTSMGDRFSTCAAPQDAHLRARVLSPAGVPAAGLCCMWTRSIDRCSSCLACLGCCETGPAGSALPSRGGLSDGMAQGALCRGHCKSRPRAAAEVAACRQSTRKLAAAGLVLTELRGVKTETTIFSAPVWQFSVAQPARRSAKPQARQLGALLAAPAPRAAQCCISHSPLSAAAPGRAQSLEHLLLLGLWPCSAVAPPLRWPGGQGSPLCCAGAVTGACDAWPGG